jgi:hypothetical protein
MGILAVQVPSVKRLLPRTPLHFRDAFWERAADQARMQIKRLSFWSLDTMSGHRIDNSLR